MAIKSEIPYLRLLWLRVSWSRKPAESGLEELFGACQPGHDAIDQPLKILARQGALPDELRQPGIQPQSDLRGQQDQWRPRHCRKSWRRWQNNGDGKDKHQGRQRRVSCGGLFPAENRLAFFLESLDAFGVVGALEHVVAQLLDAFEDARLQRRRIG